MVNWETVDVPAGAFIGWGQKKGQHVTGKVLAYDPVGGTDFGGAACPQLEVELTEPAASYNKALERTDHDAGEFVSVTGGLDGLKKGLRRGDPAAGDLIKIVLDGLEDIGGGKTVKRFTIQIARGAGGPASKKAAVSAGFNGSGGAADDDEPPF